MLSAESLTAKEGRDGAWQTVLLHASSMFDTNECALDWFPNNKDVRQYGDLLIDVIVGELPDILSNEYDPRRAI